jgi:hypothetical protein
MLINVELDPVVSPVTHAYLKLVDAGTAGLHQADAPPALGSKE